MKVKELVYYILDSIKNISDDSIITEDHIIFLIKKYRSFFIKREQEGNRNVSGEQSDFETQQICLDLEKTEGLPGFPCEGGYYLRSKQELPKILEGASTTVYPVDYYGSINLVFISRERMRFVGTNRFLGNIIYVSSGPDNHVYLKSANPQFLYLRRLRVNTVFEDFDKAAKLSCDDCGDSTPCDFLDAELPIRDYLVPQIIEAIEKEVLGVAYRPADTVNNASDDMSSPESLRRQAANNTQQ